MYGKTLATTKPELEQKLMSNRVIDSNGCWIWKGNLIKGYGSQKYQDSYYLVHRLSLYLYNNFDLNNPLLVLHKPFICKSKACFNPEHLYVGTDTDNMRDMFLTGTNKCGIRQKEKTHCPQGHEYNKKNTYYIKNRRICKICTANRTRLYRMKEKEFLSKSKV